MKDRELIGQDRKSHLPLPLAEEQLAVSGNHQISETFSYHSSSIATCQDLPIYQMPIFKKIITDVEPEPIIPQVTAKAKEQENVRVHFFKRAMQTAPTKIVQTFKQIRDTISTYAESVVTFFTGTRSVEPKKDAPVIAAKKMHVAAAAPKKTQVDFEQARIEEIEREFAVYETELANVGTDNSRKLMELVYKVLYLAGSLAKRHAKLETRKYHEELERNVKERQKTFHNGRGWTIFSVIVNFASAGLSFAPLAGGFLKAANPVAGRVCRDLGKTTQALSGFGSAAGKLDELQDAKNQSKRLGLERYKEIFDDVVRNMKSSEDKVSGLSTELLSMWKELNRSETSTKKQAIGGQ